MSNIEKHQSKDLAQIVSEMDEDHRDICKALAKYNQIRKFPLTAIEIMEWKDSILQARPNIDPKAIEFIIDKMISGEIDSVHGDIRNIFNALERRLDRDANGYKLKPDMTW